MRKTLLAGVALAAGLLTANAASASVVLYSDFENDGAINQGFGSWGVYGAADGWTTLSGPGIEIQNHAAGEPDAAGGTNFVELDSHSNSSMFYEFAASGNYDLSFLFSPRPGVSAASNVVDVYLDKVLLTSATGGPLGATSWGSVSSSFYAAAGQRLIFAAAGASDSLGGYVDNMSISTSAVPEPATWAMMIAGFGLAGSAIRRRRATAVFA